MNYIDAHTHLGDCRVFDMDITEDQLLQTMEDSGINAAIVQPFPCPVDYKEIHNRIYRLSKDYPGKVYGLVSVNPHKSREELESEIRAYVEEYGFVGVKLHTQGHAVNPQSRDAHALYEIAGKLGVPVNIHTGLGIPFAMPSLCLPVAKMYPEITFVIAHSGSLMFASEAVILAQECKNVYLDTTMCVIEDLLMILKNIGSERLLYASDSLKSTSLEMKKFQAAELEEEQLKDIFYRNAAKVFHLKKYLD